MGVVFGENLKKYNQAYLKMDELYHMIAQKAGLSDCAFWILYYICQEGEGRSQKEISKTLLLSKQTIHSAVRKLEQEGIIFLQAGAGRDKNIFLTEEGKQLIEEKVNPIIVMENKTFAKMEAEEAEELQRLTWRYVNLLQETYEEKIQNERGEW